MVRKKAKAKKKVAKKKVAKKKVAKKKVARKKASNTIPASGKGSRPRGLRPKALRNLLPLGDEENESGSNESYNETPLDKNDGLYQLDMDQVSQIETLEDLFNESEPSIKNLSNVQSQQRKVMYLVTYIKTGRNDIGCRAAGINQHVPYIWSEYDAQFAKAWAYCRERFSQLLEDAAVKRGVHGTLKPVYQEGRLVGHERQYSDTMLTLLLKGNNPSKYAGHTVRDERNKAADKAKKKARRGMSREAANEMRRSLLGLDGKK